MNQQTVRFLASVVAVSIQPLHALSECEGRAERTNETFSLFLSMQSFTTKFEIADTLVTSVCTTIEKVVLIASKLCLMIVGGITVAITIFVHRKTILKYLYCCLTCRKVRSNMTSITCQEP
eukprot:TRINITY_DN5740_c0_g1_i5.p1 TRINITY_DN5740_c0_g1~~TRINITY_DN5740_c0_g1_i5.p1  ORF type:complete len:121 (+),score=5.45 TRINITY_DN5740_c0_g1_i5:30-392(+)